MSTMEEYHRELQRVAEANAAIRSPQEIAAAHAREQAAARDMGQWAAEQRAEQARQAERERQAKEDQEEAAREQAEAAYLRQVEHRFLHTGGTKAAWQALKPDVLRKYREELLGGSTFASAVATKRAGGDYGL